MPATFTIDMDALAQAIDALPDHLQAEADQVVSGAAKRTAARIRARYRQAKSDVDTRKHLADSVTTRTTVKNRGSVAARVAVTAPHAHLYEYGTAVRRTKAGAGRGTMPAQPTLVPAAIAERETMVSELVALVEAQGFTVRRSV